MSIIAKIGVYGDIHLCSKNYGAHRDYPKESLEYFHKITELTEENQLTHLIGCGDFSFGRFNTNEYRLAVDRELEKQFSLVHGNRYELQGNHDIVTYGMGERDYYIEKGLLKPSENLTIGNFHLTMVDYGKHLKTVPNIIDNEQTVNFAIAHDFYKFTDSKVANFGKAIDLDNFEQWFGLDGLICGHVHKIMQFDGCIQKEGLGHIVKVYYPGCMTRPSYREGYTDEIGQFIIITVEDNGNIDFDIKEISLWKLEDAFNLEVKEKEKEAKAEKEARVDISEIVKQLDLHDNNVGNPEDIIAGMQGVDEKYKNKAIELLKNALK